MKLAQISAEKSKMALSLKGTTSVTEHGSMNVHTYIGREDGGFSHMEIAEGWTRVVGFDGEFFLPCAEEVATPVRAGCPHRLFPGAPVCGRADFAKDLPRNGQKILDARR
jgi:hypothetical protein